jgi:hypothetical protein
MMLSSTCFLVAAQKTDSPDRSRYKLGGGSAAARLRLTLEASVGVDAFWRSGAWLRWNSSTCCAFGL